MQISRCINAITNATARFCNFCSFVIWFMYKQTTGTYFFRIEDEIELDRIGSYCIEFCTDNPQTILLRAFEYIWKKLKETREIRGNEWLVGWRLSHGCLNFLYFLENWSLKMMFAKFQTNRTKNEKEKLFPIKTLPLSLALSYQVAPTQSPSF